MSTFLVDRRRATRRAAAAIALLSLGGAAAAVERGGELVFTVASEPPSYDLHRETTFGVIHPIAPFYSLLLRINPDNPQASDDFVCDLCAGDVPAAEDGGLVYRFRIRDDVRFHDGSPLSAADVKATFDRIIFPPEGVPSARRAQLAMVKAIEAPDAQTVVFTLHYPSGAFLPALATPFNAVYSKKDLDAHGHEWHTRNINGTGPFTFVESKAGAHIRGARYAAYHHRGVDGQPLPYLDAFQALQAPKEAVRVQSIRGNRAAMEFRGLPPSARDDLVKALGDRVTVQESDWNCVLLATPNQQKKPFDDPRVRRALTLAVDRQEGSRYLSRIAIVKTVGGVVFPGHPLAASSEELAGMAGYWPDIEASRAEARRLLAEAGVAGLSFELNNRAVDQPYKIVGTWLIDQWSKIGVKVNQTVLPTGPFYDRLRKKKDFDVSLDFNCQSLVNPLSDITKFLGGSGDNYGNYQDAVLDDLHQRMNRSADVAEQRALMRQFERRVLDEMAHEAVTLWWYRIVPHRSYVQGWKISPSHYLNQQLDNVWLDPSRM